MNKRNTHKLIKEKFTLTINRGGEYAVNSHFGCLLLTANYLLLTGLLTAKI